MHELTKPQLLGIAKGATFLGCGGGWPLYSALRVLEAFPEDGTVSVASVDEAAGDTAKLTVMVAYLGAPTAAANLTDINGAIRAFDMASEYARTALGKEIGYVIPVEIGALNTITPCLVAAARNIPVVDGDGAGRAVPALEMTTFADKVGTAPMIMSNGTGFDVSLSAMSSASQADSLARDLIADPAFDDIAGLAMWIMDGPTLASAVPIRGTLGLAEGVGKALEQTQDPIGSVIAYLDANGRTSYRLFDGTLSAESDTAQGGFDVGRTTFSNASTGEIVSVYDENENLMAWSSNASRALAMAPDSICYVTADGLPFSNADVDHFSLIGHQASIVGVTACAPLAADTGVMTAFRAALVELGYGGKMVPISDLRPD
ncbi:MAG: DUF917 domain-containing protein [Pseudomonadota bacterium]